MLEEVETDAQDVGVTKWEYRILADRGRMHKVTIEEINEVGIEGWELIILAPTPGGKTGEVNYYFKRPIP